jgi:hypothetical protein
MKKSREKKEGWENESEICTAVRSYKEFTKTSDHYKLSLKINV